LAILILLFAAEVADREHFLAFLRYGYALLADSKMAGMMEVWYRLEIVFSNHTSPITNRFDRVAYHCVQMLSCMDLVQRKSREEQIIYLLWAIRWLKRTGITPDEGEGVWRHVKFFFLIHSLGSTNV
jgi:hypothetical protein